MTARRLPTDAWANAVPDSSFDAVAMLRRLRRREKCFGCYAPPLGVHNGGMISPRENWELLQSYVHHRDETAFARIVAGHVDLVYSSAVRQVRDRHLAEEVTQAVFGLLAQKAPTLGAGVILPAYLLKATYFMSKNAIKRENRRRLHERKAAEMAARSLPGDVVSTMSELLDEGMHQLNDRERAALVLRFFEQRSMAEAGEAMGVSEDAAAMRVSRAIGKLRQFFRSRKLTLDAAEAGTLLTVIAIRTAPPQLADAAASTAMTLTSASDGAATGPTMLSDLIGGATNAMRQEEIRSTLRWTAAAVAVVVAACLLSHLLMTILRPTPIIHDRPTVMD